MLHVRAPACVPLIPGSVYFLTSTSPFPPLQTPATTAVFLTANPQLQSVPVSLKPMLVFGSQGKFLFGLIWVCLLQVKPTTSPDVHCEEEEKSICPVVQNISAILLLSIKILNLFKHPPEVLFFKLLVILLLSLDVIQLSTLHLISDEEFQTWRRSLVRSWG